MGCKRNGSSEWWHFTIFGAETVLLVVVRAPIFFDVLLLESTFELQLA
jgi:hypothetical protein